MRRGWLLLGFVLLGGCGSTPTVTLPDAAIFAPTAMRLHPIFTHLKDWTGDDRPDGIEALVELQDQFGDPVKASGQVIFELFAYEKHSPNPRGVRLLNPWIADLSTIQNQRERWNRTSRTYSFELAYPQVRDDRSYVLAATFQLNGGGRFFNQIVLEMKPPATRPTSGPSSEPATAPASEPSTAPTTSPSTGPSTAPVVQPTVVPSGG